MNALQKYGAAEDAVIREFGESRFFTVVLPGFNRKEFTQYLLQLGCISSEFVKFLERTKLGLATETGKEAIRKILRDEIPALGPTHQDNRVSDLLRMGVPLKTILNSKPARETSGAINEYYRFIRYPQKFYDVRVIVFVRVIGEVLVGETYKHVVKGISKRYNLKPEESLFYAPHWKHDIKGGIDSGSKGHTEYYDRVLTELINERSLSIAINAAKTASCIRTRFNAQFE